jgi:arginyl-tRNA synthetase
LYVLGRFSTVEGIAVIRKTIKGRLEKAVVALVDRGLLSREALLVAPSMGISRTKDKSRGDFSSNLAMILAKTEQKTPLEVATLIKDEMSLDKTYFDSIDVAGPGFINLRLSDFALNKILEHIGKLGPEYGRLPRLNKKALVEFVSANPTGGLHLGHARGAFAGDALARLLSAAGYDVLKEFYINDTGVQVQTLARTIHKRYRELFGQKVVIEDNEYPGEYVKDIAQKLKELHGDRWLDKPEEVWLLPITKFGVDYNLSRIKRSLDGAGIDFDTWLSEETLHQSGALDDVVKAYQERHMLYEADTAHQTEDKIRREDSKAFKFAHLQEGGLFIKTSQFGDTEDRIIKRRDGRFVYLTADLAYHHQKFLRGFDLIIDVFGADHAGHIGRIKAGMAALNHDITKLKFVVVQIMRLLKGGKELRFSKRAGEVVGLDDLISLVGKDVARFVFLMRATTTQFDLDLDAVTEQSRDNPVFYVQYGHARMATILQKAKRDHGLVPDPRHLNDQEKLPAFSLPEERELLLLAGDLEETVKEAALALEPHRIIYFCQELIKNFHSYFTKYRGTEKIISEDKAKTLARLNLVFVLKQTIFNGLSFIGVSAPDRMELPSEGDDV